MLSYEQETEGDLEAEPFAASKGWYEKFARDALDTAQNNACSPKRSRSACGENCCIHLEDSPPTKNAQISALRHHSHG